MRVEVVNAKEIMVDPKASIAIVVPFTVKNSKELGISDTAHVGRITIISEGNYALLYETGYNKDKSMWFRLTFSPQKDVQAEILRNTGNILSPSYPLLMVAELAD